MVKPDQLLNEITPAPGSESRTLFAPLPPTLILPDGKTVTTLGAQVKKSMFEDPAFRKEHHLDGFSSNLALFSSCLSDKEINALITTCVGRRNDEGSFVADLSTPFVRYHYLNVLLANLTPEKVAALEESTQELIGLDVDLPRALTALQVLRLEAAQEMLDEENVVQFTVIPAPSPEVNVARKNRKETVDFLLQHFPDVFTSSSAFVRLFPFVDQEAMLNVDRHDYPEPAAKLLDMIAPLLQALQASGVDLKSLDMAIDLALSEVLKKDEPLLLVRLGTSSSLALALDEIPVNMNLQRHREAQAAVIHLQASKNERLLQLDDGCDGHLEENSAGGAVHVEHDATIEIDENYGCLRVYSYAKGPSPSVFIHSQNQPEGKMPSLDGRVEIQSGDAVLVFDGPDDTENITWYIPPRGYPDKEIPLVYTTVPGAQFTDLVQLRGVDFEATTIGEEVILPEEFIPSAFRVGERRFAIVPIKSVGTSTINSGPGGKTAYYLFEYDGENIPHPVIAFRNAQEFGNRKGARDIPFNVKENPPTAR